jgi:hypothetical protein
VRERVFAILAEVVPEGFNGKADAHTGRPGMEQWTILVLGTLRLSLNIDYDRVHELANEHKTLRLMLGHSGWADDETSRYQLQTIKDNLRLFTPEILARVNQEVVNAGHQLVKKVPTPRWRCALIPVWSRPMSIFPLTSICCGMRCVS